MHQPLVPIAEKLNIPSVRTKSESKTSPHALFSNGKYEYTMAPLSPIFVLFSNITVT